MSNENIEKSRAFVYYAALPRRMGERKLYPPSRMTEIERCKSEKTKREKYYVWALLEMALKNALNLSIDNLKFTKQLNNKWICDKCYFSLTHTEGLVAVAVSQAPIGIDAERTRALRGGIEGRLLSEREMRELAQIPDGEREEYLIRKWCEKESIFKSRDKEALLPRSIETGDYTTVAREIAVGGKRYILAVATDLDVSVKEMKLEG